MEILSPRKIISLLEGDSSFRPAGNQEIRADRGILISSFPEVVEKVAQLSFHNPEQILLFRGQSREWRNSWKNTTIMPSIFRVFKGTKPPSSQELEGRYHTLDHAEQLLLEVFSKSHLLGRRRIGQHRLLRWAILQHYEICGTPLLDVTQSLRVAASFAINDKSETEPVLYVLGVPALSGSITASSEQGIQIIRLSSICPPEARRPYFQEGYLVTEYPELATITEKQNYRPHENDFGRRLICKFRLARTGFWSKDYSAIPNEALYPNERDPLVELAIEVKRRMAS